MSWLLAGETRVYIVIMAAACGHKTAINLGA